MGLIVRGNGGCVNEVKKKMQAGTKKGCLFFFLSLSAAGGERGALSAEFSRRSGEGEHH